MSDSRSPARYEFRLFGQGFSRWHQRMARLSTPVPEKFWRRQSAEVYLLSRQDIGHNIKLRDGMLDIKVLLARQQGLEQWDVAAKLALPALPAELLTQLDSLSGFSGLSLPDTVTEDALLTAVSRHSELLAVRVEKVRHGYRIGTALCEFATVFVNDARVESIGVEADLPEDAHSAIRLIGLPSSDNICYPEAIRRIVGWSPLRLLVQPEEK